MNPTMNFELDGFMQPKKRGRKPRTLGFSRTIGVHIPSKTDMDFLDMRAKADYRSWSEYLYLLLRRDREHWESQMGQGQNLAA
jgi:hypothetical protein